MRLEGQVAIVTGAGQGIGRAIAITFAREGAAVTVNDINFKLVEKVTDEIKLQGGKAQPIRADISRAKEVSTLVEKTVSYFNKVDILVNNAGICKLTPAIEIAEAEWDSTLDINLKGQFLCCQAVARYMIEQKRGKIINIASAGGHVAAAGAASYGTSKGGVLQLTRQLAVEWGKHNINVNAVSPGLTMTPLHEGTAKVRPDFLKGIERIPLKRAARPEDIANTVLFLASSESGLYYWTSDSC